MLHVTQAELPGVAHEEKKIKFWKIIFSKNYVDLMVFVKLCVVLVPWLPTVYLLLPYETPLIEYQVSSTINSNKEFVHSQYIAVQVSSVFLIIVIIKCLTYSKRSAICVIYFLFLHFFILSWKTCQLLWENLVFLFIFDTCDVMFDWSISLLPPIVLDNIFGAPYIRTLYDLISLCIWLSQYIMYRYFQRQQFW